MDSPRRRTLATLLLQLGIVGAFVAIVVALYPLSYRRQDEAGYVATAFKMARTWTLYSATHREQDVLEHGLDHKGVKMPGYSVALAGWLSIVPDPAYVRIFNLLLFSLAVLMLYRLIVSRLGKPTWPAALAGATLLALPLGIAYANTAMAEAWVIFVAVLHFVSWYAEGRRRLLWFYLTTFLAFVTKETLVLLTLSIVTVHAREFGRLHLEVWRRSRPALIGHVALAIVLATAGLYCFVDRGYFPNFRTQLAEAPDLGTMFGMIADKLGENLAYFVSWNRFPNDYLYSYVLAAFGMAIGLTVWSRRTPAFRLHLMLTVFWTSTLLSVNALYQNQYFNAHRIYEICTLLTLFAWYCWVPKHVEKPMARWAMLATPLVIHLVLAVVINAHFIADRPRPPEDRPDTGFTKQHFLTESGLVRPGDCLFARAGAYQFLAENQRAEVINPMPRDNDRILAIIDKGQPRFVICSDELDLKSRGYQEIGKFPFASKRGSNQKVYRIAWMKPRRKPK